ncbi:hypothetical protein LXL04_019402 [Taraxacum kok-saghyz]
MKRRCNMNHRFETKQPKIRMLVIFGLMKTIKKHTPGKIDKFWLYPKTSCPHSQLQTNLTIN